MPKDWLRYKAEIQRLYIVEEKTVYQVREILKAKHSFSASVRAYRMKFDEWGMRKYKSQKSRSNTASSSASTQPQFSPPPASNRFLPSNSSSQHPTSAEMGSIQGGEPPPTRISEVMALVNVQTASSLDILETIFLHWQPDPEFTSTLVDYFSNPDFDKWVSRQPGPPAVFQLIENFVAGRENQFDLMKALLEADLSIRQDTHVHLTPWQEAWYHACNSLDWEPGKELLLDDDGVLSQGSRVFLDCLDVVMAERFLKKYSQMLIYWMGRPLDALQIAGKDGCTKKYREVLRNFHQAQENVSPAFYRFLLRFDLADENGSGKSRAYEDEYRQKYIQLSSLRSGRGYGMEQDDEEEDEEGERMLHLDNNISKPNLPPTPPTGFAHPGNNLPPSNPPPASSAGMVHSDNNVSEPDLPPTPPTPYAPSPDLNNALTHPPVTNPTPKALSILIQKWHYLSGFEKYTHSLLARDDGITLSIFTPPSISHTHSEAENMFDAISKTTPNPNENSLSLTKALLVTSSNTTLTTSMPWLLQWWISIYPPSTSPSLTYNNFQTQLLHNKQLAEHIDHAIKTEEGRRLFVDATIALVGERMLGNLRTRMVRNGDDGIRNKLQGKFLAVLGLFRERGIVVDKSWNGYWF